MAVDELKAYEVVSKPDRTGSDRIASPRLELAVGSPSEPSAGASALLPKPDMRKAMSALQPVFVRIAPVGGRSGPVVGMASNAP